MNRIPLFLFISLLFLLNQPLCAQWQYAGAPGRISCLVEKNDTLFAGCNTGVYASADNGSTWILISNGLGTREVTSLLSFGNSLYAGTTDGVFVLAKNANGLYWYQWYVQPFACPNVWQLFVFDGKIYANTKKISQTQICAGLLKWVAGSGWQTLSNLQFNCIAEYGGNLIGSSGFTVFSSSDKGSTWSQLTTFQTAVGLLAVNGNSIYASTNNGLYLSADGGTQWQAVRNGYSYVFPINNTVYYGTPGCMVFDPPRFYAGSSSYNGSDGWGAGFYFSINNAGSWTRDNVGFEPNAANSFPPAITSLLMHNQYLFAGTQNQGVWKRALWELTAAEELQQSASAFRVYPNPVNDDLTVFIDLQGITGNTIDFSVSDMFGRGIVAVKNNPAGKTMEINLTELPPGVYQLHLYSDHRFVGVQKIVKQ